MAESLLLNYIIGEWVEGTSEISNIIPLTLEM